MTLIRQFLDSIRSYCSLSLQEPRHLTNEQIRTLINLLDEHRNREDSRSILQQYALKWSISSDLACKLFARHCVQYWQARRIHLLALIPLLFNVDMCLDNYERTLLHVSVQAHDVDLVTLLLRHGANVNPTDRLGNTALHVAIQSCRRLQSKYKYESSSLSINCGQNVSSAPQLTAIIKLLLSSPVGGHRLSDSSSDTDVSATNAEQLVLRNTLANNMKQHAMCSSGAPIGISMASNAQCYQQEYATRAQCTMNSKRMPSINVSNHNEQQAIGNRSEASFRICSRQRLVNACNQYGRTALHYCCLSVSHEYLSHFIQILLAYGADPNAIDHKLRTPFYYLVKRPDLGNDTVRSECILLMLNAGADHLGLSNQAAIVTNPDRKSSDTDNSKYNQQLYLAKYQEQEMDQNNNNHRGNLHANLAHDGHHTQSNLVCDLKHLARCAVVHNQSSFKYPTDQLPDTLLAYIRRQTLFDNREHYETQ